MKKMIVEVEVPDDFEIGKCKKCDFHRGSDQCDLKYLLTRGVCNLNCICPLKTNNNSNLK